MHLHDTLGDNVSRVDEDTRSLPGRRVVCVPRIGRGFRPKKSENSRRIDGCKRNDVVVMPRCGVCHGRVMRAAQRAMLRRM